MIGDNCRDIVRYDEKKAPCGPQFQTLPDRCESMERMFLNMRALKQNAEPNGPAQLPAFDAERT